MARDVLVDLANIISEINKGNDPVAQALAKMKADGANLYYDEQGFREAVTNNSRQLEAAANRQTLQDLGFRPVPGGSANLRADFHALNSAGGNFAHIQDGASFQKNPDKESSQKRILVESKGIGNLRDAAIGATAYANDFEIFSIDGTFASPTKQQQLKSAFTRLRIAPESVSLFGTKAPSTSTDFRVGRRLLGLPAYTQAGRGAPVKPLASATPGFDPERTHTVAIAGIMAMGAIVGWLDDYHIEEAMKKDIAEWETYIRSRQSIDPATGFLLVAIIKRWQPRDAAYATRSYVGLEKIEAGSLSAAIALARRNIPPGLPVPTDTVSYEYAQMWIAPLYPRPTLSSAEADEKAYGTQHWYPAFRRLRQSLEPPPDYGEALSVLVGSWMLSMIRILDHLSSYSPGQFNELKAQLHHLSEPINRARVGLAFRAVEDHRSDSSFGLQHFLEDSQNKADYDRLPSDQQKEIAEWIESGSGALKNAMQGQWEVIMDGKKYLYSFRLSGTVIYRSPDNPCGIAGEGKWDVSESGVRVHWPKTGTVEIFPAPLKTENQPARSITKGGGTFNMQARKVNPYP